MKLKKKLSIIIIIMLSILFILPLIFINLLEPRDGMGVLIILFFIINPISIISINSIIGKDIKKLWWIPIIFSILFLLSYWLILNEIILELIIYAIIYLIIGIICIIIKLYKKNK